MRERVALMRLTPRLKFAVASYFAPGAPPARVVASLMGITEGAFRKRIQRARRLVRRVEPTALPSKPRGRVRRRPAQLSAIQLAA